MTMRYGGHIAATACFVFFAATAYGQAAGQTPASQNQTPAQQNATQPPANNPESQANPSPGQKQLTPEEEEKEREQKIRLYDPLAKEDKTGGANQKGANQNGGGQGEKGDSAGGAAAQPSEPEAAPNGAESAGAAPSGPAVATEEAGDEAPPYSGPPVLSRPYSILRPQIPTGQRWTPFLGLNGVYDSGIAGYATNAQGNLVARGSFGTEMFWGISGRQYFHHRDVLGLDYRGNIQYYSPAKYYDGSNHYLTLDYTHFFSRRISLTLVEAGSVYSQDYALGNPVVVAEEAPSISGGSSPNVQLFNNGYKNLTTAADVTWQKSARLSFNVGGSGFLTKFDSPFLFGVIGEQAHGDVSYRFTRRFTAGITYAYNQFAFSHNAGSSEFHTVDGFFSWAISSTLQLRASGGASRLETRGLTSLAVPVSLQQLLGNTVIAQYQTKEWTSDYSVQLFKDFRRGRSASLAYRRGIMPGNGIYLTSLQQDATATAAFVLRRHYYTAAGGGYDSLSSASQALAAYRDFFAFAGGSRTLPHGFQANLRFDYRHFLVSNTPLLENAYRLTLGVSWSPREGFQRLW